MTVPYFKEANLLSNPSIPNISPTITLTRDDAINLLLSSIAMEELALAHIINAEGEAPICFGDADWNQRSSSYTRIGANLKLLDRKRQLRKLDYS